MDLMAISLSSSAKFVKRKCLLSALIIMNRTSFNFAISSITAFAASARSILFSNDATVFKIYLLFFSLLVLPLSFGVPRLCLANKYLNYCHFSFRFFKTNKLLRYFVFTFCNRTVHFKKTLIKL